MLFRVLLHLLPSHERVRGILERTTGEELCTIRKSWETRVHFFLQFYNNFQRTFGIIDSIVSVFRRQKEMMPFITTSARMQQVIRKEEIVRVRGFRPVDLLSHIHVEHLSRKAQGVH